MSTNKASTPGVLSINFRPRSTPSTNTAVDKASASMAVGALSVWFAAWAAAKIFRIGILMYGKPPNFKTLLKWVSMA